MGGDPHFVLSPTSRESRWFVCEEPWRRSVHPPLPPNALSGAEQYRRARVRFRVIEKPPLVGFVTLTGVGTRG